MTAEIIDLDKIVLNEHLIYELGQKDSFILKHRKGDDSQDNFIADLRNSLQEEYDNMFDRRGNGFAYFYFYRRQA